MQSVHTGMLVMIQVTSAVDNNKQMCFMFFSVLLLVGMGTLNALFLGQFQTGPRI